MDDEILYEIMDTYGCIMQQVDVAVEEMSELTKALMEYRRAVATKAKKEVSPLYNFSFINQRERENVFCTVN